MNSVIATIEREAQRQALISLLILIALAAIMLWALYHVIRCAIRDGIDQSSLGREQKRPESPFTRE